MAAIATIGIFALVNLILGVVFTILGFATDSEDTDGFATVGPALLLVGLVLGGVFAVLVRRGRAKRERRQARTQAEVVRAKFRAGVRIGAWATYDLTVRFAAAGGEVTRQVQVVPGTNLKEGEQIEIAFDPDEPSSFEPVGGASY